MKTFISCLIALVVFLGSFTACQRYLSPKGQLQTILHSTSGCSAPCWQDILPGESTENDFLSRIKSLPEHEFHDLRDQRIDIQRTYYVWENRETDYVGALEIRNDEIAYIIFQHLDKELMLESTIELLGLPDAYVATVAPGESALFDLNLIFVEEGVIVNSRIVPYDTLSSAFQPSCSVTVTADIPVSEIYLTEPFASASDTIHNLSGLIPAFEEPQTWPGFGLIELTSCPH
ncbi:MAG: hypothetical protein IT327_18400 [Anaerolineae bacterium]|nr:hypothetical protein [Anaerolineae bacterium]